METEEARGRGRRFIEQRPGKGKTKQWTSNNHTTIAEERRRFGCSSDGDWNHQLLGYASHCLIRKSIERTREAAKGDAEEEMEAVELKRPWKSFIN